MKILEGTRVDIIAFDLYGNPFLVDNILLLYPSFCFYPILPSLELNIPEPKEEE
jgi:hypothetical protein